MQKKSQESIKNEVAQKEEEVLAFWKQEKIFEQSLEKDAPQGEFVFYDGPPYGTGVAHYGHLLAGTMKDVIPRYKTMQGYRVPRRWGWDCHGLPIENLIEKELNLSTKKDIEEYGVAEFNKAARESVLRFAADWEEIVPRSGRWVNMDDPYMTMNASYMESVWWVFKTLHEKGHIYKGFKPMHVCPRCETPLANFEVNLGYADVTDITVTAMFELVDQPGTYVLAWTTTPWTLPGNVSLAVGENITYVRVEYEGKKYIVAKDRYELVFADKESEVEVEYSGKKLVGQKYQPVFDYYSSDEDLENRENGWKIYAAEFVTTEEGTGIVHIAPAFGSDDMELGKQYDLPFVQHVTMGGRFTPEVTDFAGMAVKKKDDTMSTDIEIVKWLAHNGKLFHKEKYVHSYPLCWRCDTPLLNYATESWFIDVPAFKDRLLANNAKTSWVPEHMRDGRFGKWLEGAREWPVSRSRYWGTPLPVWTNEEGTKQLVVGSVGDLKQYVQRSGNTYHIMRHGEAESNIGRTISSRDTEIHPLTEQGQEQVRAAVSGLSGSGIDLIIVSPMLRTRQTAQIVKEELGLNDEQVIVDERLREQNPGDFEGKTWDEYHDYVASLRGDKSWFTTPIAGGESYLDVKKRAGELLYELEEKYADKNILLVAHGGVSWILHVVALEHLPDNQAYAKANGNKAFVEGYTPMQTAEVRRLPFVPVPHNSNYDLDLHRPYIDEVVLEKDGEVYERVHDVFDVWFDSGSMPYGQLHYPFENKELLETSRFPAQFIAEGLDQTRGWFYVIMVLATALFDKPAFEQVIVNGMVLAEDGKKMSKRLKNYPEVRYIFDTYGADAMRLFLMSQPLVRAESSNFTEKGVQDAGNKVMRRLRNVHKLYDLYKEGDHAEPANSKHVLDMWMLARLAQFEQDLSTALDAYQLDQGARHIFEYIDDLSTWYVRRCRDRLKNTDNDAAYARGTLRHALQETCKLLAPYVPFVAEEVWQKVRCDDQPISVHLASWPKGKQPDMALLERMQHVRDMVSATLLLRDEAGIKVRQPLAKVTIPRDMGEDLRAVLADEVNVKEVIVDDTHELDTTLTDDLKKEGAARELVRHIQSLRKKTGLMPDDTISIEIAANSTGKKVIDIWREFITTTTNTADVEMVDLGVPGDVIAHDAHFSVTIK